MFRHNSAAAGGDAVAGVVGKGCAHCIGQGRRDRPEIYDHAGNPVRHGRTRANGKFSPEVRDRAVRLVLDNQGQHGSRWQAVLSISPMIGCAPQTLNDGVNKAEVDSGKRAGVSREMAEKSAPLFAMGPRTMASDFTCVATWKGFVHVAFVIDA